MKFRFLFGLALTGAALMSGFQANAQCKGWTWPEDKATAEEKQVLYKDAYRQKKYAAAQKPHMWLLKNAPNLNTSLYIDGATIYRELATAEQDSVRKKALIDSTLLMYDLRMQICGDEVNVLNRRASGMYRFYIKDKEKQKYLLDLYDAAIEKSGDNISTSLPRGYFNAMKMNKLGLKNMTDEEALDRYDHIVEVIEKKIDAGGEKVDTWKKSLEFVNGIFPTIVKIDCDFVRENFGPKFKESQDLGSAKRIFKYMLVSKCTDDPLWLEAAKVVQNNKPQASLALILGKKCLAEKDYSCADTYFSQAIEMSSNNSEKAEIYINQGLANARRGRKSAARDLFRKALSLDPSHKEAYGHIGSLYFNSVKECAGKVDKVKDRLAYIAAYEMYRKAGNNRMMTSAKSQFPSKEEIFERNYQKGQSMSVGCWIGETVVLDTRD